MIKVLISLAITLSLLAAPLVPSVAFADAKTDVCEGLGIASGNKGCDEPTTGPTVNTTMQLVVNILSFIVGIASVVMIIIGGFKYVISAGDSGNITGAKNTILYALVGLVVVALAQVIVRFVLNKAAPSTGAPAAPTSLVIKVTAG